MHQTFSKADFFYSINNFDSEVLRSCAILSEYSAWLKWSCFPSQTSKRAYTTLIFSFIEKNICFYLCVPACACMCMCVCVCVVCKHTHVHAGMLTCAHADGRRGLYLPPLSPSIYFSEVGSPTECRAQVSARLKATKQTTVTLLSLSSWSWGYGSLFFMCWDLNSGPSDFGASILNYWAASPATVIFLKANLHHTDKHRLGSY